MQLARKLGITLRKLFLNVLSPTVAIGFNPPAFKFCVRGFQAVVKRIELNLPTKRNVSPLVFDARHDYQENWIKPLVFPRVVLVSNALLDILRDSPFR